MSGALARLTVALGLDAAEFVTGMTKAEREAQRFSARLQRDVAAGIIKAQVAMQAFTQVVTRAIPALITGAGAAQDFAEKIGGSAESIASLTSAMGASDTRIDSVAAASVRLTKGLTGVDDESKAAGAALVALNLPIEAFKRLDPVAQLEAAAKAMATFEDDSGKTAVAVALFGKAGADMLPFLKELGQENARQTILTGAMIKQADDFSDKLGRQRAEATQYAQAVASQAIPALSGMFDVSMKVLKAYLDTDVAASALKLTFGALVLGFQAVATVGAVAAAGFTAIGIQLGSFAAQVAAFVRGDFDQLKVIRVAAAEDVAAAKATYKAFLQDVRNITGPGADDEARRRLGRGPGRDRLKFDGAEGSSKGKDREAEAKRYLEALEKQSEKQQQLTREEQALQDIQKNRLGFVSDSMRAQILDAARLVDLEKQRILTAEALGKTAANWDRLQEAQQEQAKQLAQAFETPMRTLERNLQELQELAEKNSYINPALMADLTMKAHAEYAKAMDQYIAKTGEVDSFTKKAAEDIQGHLGDGLYSVLMGDFDNIGNAFKSMLARMVADAQAAEIAKGLFGGLVQGGTGKGLLGSALSKLGGFIFGGGGGVADESGGHTAGRAIGGPVEAGGRYRVAENRPELLRVNGESYLMMGNQRGYVDPNPRGASGGMVLNVYGGVNRNELMSAMQQAAAAAVGAVQEQRRRGFA